ncbi:MAG: hypothetical protein LUQ47_01535 [Methanotrichaceae archaeon]|nr:hypothetical protein [Methanotrichaceae archaeon]
MTDDKESIEDGDHAINDNGPDQLTDWISTIDSKKHRNRNELERLRIDLEDETKKIAELAEKKEAKKE